MSIDRKCQNGMDRVEDGEGVEERVLRTAKRWEEGDRPADPEDDGDDQFADDYGVGVVIEMVSISARLLVRT